MKIGILGGGQLARMLAESSNELGIEIICIDPSNACSAHFVTEVHHCELSDVEKIQQVFADVDYVTYETENLQMSHIDRLANQFKIYPDMAALKVTQDRLYEKQLLTQLEIPTPAYLPVNSLNELNNAITQLGCPCVLKTRRNGYDGKGQFVIRDIDDAEKAWDAMPSIDLILEKFISYDFEVSLISVRSKSGEIKFYPLTLNRHENGILQWSEAPYYNQDLEKFAHQYARSVLKKFNYIGVMAIEFFCVNRSLLVNEIAPRVHNSGHWTIEGADTSQFENHLRAIADLPLGSTNASHYSAMMNCIGNEPHDIQGLLQIEGLHYHSYGKAARNNRKLGHITICANSKEKLASSVNECINAI